VPVDIPRVRYEVLTRQVRTGHTPPVANAGPDQVGVAAGAVAIDASASYSPEGLPLTFKWSQIGGPVTSLASDTSAKTTFTATAGHTYQFRVVVTDSLGAQAIASTTITTSEGEVPRILRFTANPTSISAGATSTLSWEVQDADTVEITTLGRVDPKTGTAPVAPTQTTSYTLTARNSTGSASQSVTVTTSTTGAVRIVSFQAQPTSINAGQSSTLTWQTENAETVTVTNLGTVAVSGSGSVAPSTTTTYTLTASNAGGQASASVTVTVAGTAGGEVSVTSFTATPASITAGGSSKLEWNTTNAVRVFIVGVGAVTPNGSVDVSPAQTTTYTLNATGADGKFASRKATVTVGTVPTNQPPTVVINNGGPMETQQYSVTLDASGSTNAGGGTLRFHWTGPAGSTIFSPDSAVTIVSRPSLGAFTYMVTVTNSEGLSTTESIVVNFLPENNILP